MIVSKMVKKLEERGNNVREKWLNDEMSDTSYILDGIIQGSLEGFLDGFWVAGAVITITTIVSYACESFKKGGK